MKKTIRLLIVILGSLSMAACASYSREQVTQEDGQNKFIRIEHPGCKTWRPQFASLLSQINEVSDKSNRVVLNCLQKGPDDAHTSVLIQVKEFVLAQRALEKSENFTYAKLGHCDGKPVFLLQRTISQALTHGITNLVFYCSKEAQQILATTKAKDYPDALVNYVNKITHNFWEEQ